MSKPNDTALQFEAKATTVIVPCFRWKCMCGYSNIVSKEELNKSKTPTKDSCAMCGTTFTLINSKLKS